VPGKTNSCSHQDLPSCDHRLRLRRAPFHVEHIEVAAAAPRQIRCKSPTFDRTLVPRETWGQAKKPQAWPQLTYSARRLGAQSHLPDFCSTWNDQHPCHRRRWLISPSPFRFPFHVERSLSNGRVPRETYCFSNKDLIHSAVLGEAWRELYLLPTKRVVSARRPRR
jgi:hypothetical protein